MSKLHFVFLGFAFSAGAASLPVNPPNEANINRNLLEISDSAPVAAALNPTPKPPPPRKKHHPVSPHH